MTRTQHRHPRRGNWQEWLDRLDSTAYGQPFVALYERDM